MAPDSSPANRGQDWPVRAIARELKMLVSSVGRVLSVAS